MQLPRGLPRRIGQGDIVTVTNIEVYSDLVCRCLACGHVWQGVSSSASRRKCYGCGRYARYNRMIFIERPYDGSEPVATVVNTGYILEGLKNRSGEPESEVYCARCNRWIPVNGARKRVICSGCQFPLSVTLLRDTPRFRLTGVARCPVATSRCLRSSRPRFCRRSKSSHSCIPLPRSCSGTTVRGFVLGVDSGRPAPKKARSNADMRNVRAAV